MASVFTQAASPLQLNLHAPKPASRFDDLSFDPMDASPLPARGLAAAGRGTKVILTGLRKDDDLNGEVGFIVFKLDDRFDGELRYRVLLRDHPDIVFVKGSNLLVDTTVDDHPIQSLLDCFKQKLGLTASMCHSVLAQALSESMIQPVSPPAGSGGDITFRLSLLASLSPVCLEDPRGQLVIWDNASFDHESDSAVVELAKIPDEQALENRCLWKNILPVKIKRKVSLLLDEGLLSWQDVLEDGNVFWEIAYTDTPDWPEPERWYQTVCNFFQLLAWERLMLNPARLYPTARLQIVRDLFFREWQSRSRRLGRELYPLYFPDEPEEARAAMAVRAKTLSDYEEERNRQVFENQQMLVKLGITTLVQDIRNERSEAEKKANERREQPSTSSAPTRASARQASADYNQPNYLPPAMLGEDGEEVEEDEDEDEDGSVAAVSDGSESDGDGFDFDFETLGAPRAPAKPSRKAKAAKKAPTGGKAKAGGERKKKWVSSRGATASVAPGGRGFVCIHPDCDEFRDTAEGIFEHIERAHPGLEPRREVRNGNEVKCLFDGCARPWVKSCLTSAGNISLSDVRKHEARHSIGDPPRKGFVCPSCDSLHDTADAAWACAATHGVEHDNKRCLWDGCGQTFGMKQGYQRHEPTHTGIWPFHCPTCGEGQTKKTTAERHCVIAAACVCGWARYACESKSNNEKNLAKHLKRCRAEGGLATVDTLAVGQVKRRKLNEAE